MNNASKINVNLIIPNQNQPRVKFEDDSLRELSKSIKEHGIIQPLILRKSKDNYEIVAGERRYRAAIMAGLTEVPAVISDMDTQKSAEVAIVENIQRKDLSSIEEARSYKKILEQGFLTQDELAKRMGLTQSSISNKLRLLNLSDEVQNALLYNKISERHARSLLKIEEKENQVKLLNETINNRLTVKKLDDLINKTYNQIESLDLNKIDTLDADDSSDDIDDVEKTETLEDNSIINDIPENLEDEDNIKEDEEKNIFSKSTFPSLESEKANLSTNIFDKIEKEEPEIDEEKTTENKSKIKENKVINKPEIKLDKDDIKTFTKELNKLEKAALKAGFEISVEDFDFTDLYQIIIKIKK